MSASIFKDGPFGQHSTISLSLNPTATIARATISNPPINLLSAPLLVDLHQFLTTLKAAGESERPKVVIFASANPTYYVAHYDLHIFSALHPLPSSSPLDGMQLSQLYRLIVQLMVSLPVIFIGEVAGQAFGAGNELLVQMDMRFAGPSTRLGALEVGLGVIHGNGGLQFLTNLIGRGRAMEFLLSSGTVNATEAEAMGWVNRSFPTNEALKEHVDALAERIATFPAAALAATKEGVNEQNPSQEALQRDLGRFASLAGRLDTQQALSKFFGMGGNEQDGEAERGLNGNLVELWK